MIDFNIPIPLIRKEEKENPPMYQYLEIEYYEPIIIPVKQNDDEAERGVIIIEL